MMMGFVFLGAVLGAAVATKVYMAVGSVMLAVLAYSATGTAVLFSALAAVVIVGALSKARGHFPGNLALD